MAQGSWVRCLLPVSFFLFPVCSSSPMSESVTQVGVGGFTLCTPKPFFLLVSFLGDTSSLGSPPCQGLFPWFSGSTLGDCLKFPYGN